MYQHANTGDSAKVGEREYGWYVTILPCIKLRSCLLICGISDYTASDASQTNK